MISAALDHPVLLDARGISKRFPGVVALDSVDFHVRAGEVHALMGQNGAGKSTLIRILTGAERPDSGEMSLRASSLTARASSPASSNDADTPYLPGSPAEAQRLGVCAVYQEVNLVPTLSVAENLYLGRQPRRWWGLNWRSMHRGARDAMSRLGVEVDVRRAIGSLPVAAQQLAAVARAVETDARMIVFDEPTSSLDARETERLFEVMSRLRARGLGLVFITHFLDQVYRISDRITVLRNGRRVGTWTAGELSKTSLISAMLGEGAMQPSRHAHRETGNTDAPSSKNTTLRVRGVGKRAVMEPVTLEARAGEVVGLAGLLGSGRTETARLIFGADRRDGGSVEVEGQPVPAGSPRRAIAAGLGLTPEDRKSDGLFLKMSIRDNIAMVVQRRLSRWGLVRRRRHAEVAREMVSRLSVACAGVDQPVGTLSGGNQQKVLLARWLAIRPRVLILDEPTRGVDIGAKGQIEGIVEELKDQGVAVVFISAELDEVARRCGRIIVLRDRRVVGELSGDAAAEDRIRAMIAGEHA